MKNRKKKLIYVAGALNADACTYIQNLHRMIKYDNKIRAIGFSTFCPGYDILGGLLAGNWEYENYFKNNQAILERCDGMFLVPGWNSSKGTAKEIDGANKLEIPIFVNAENMVCYFRHND